MLAPQLSSDAAAERSTDAPERSADAPELNLAFPLCRDPGHELAIRRVLGRCVEFLKARLGPRDLIAVILTGSFARGEGTVLSVDGQVRVLGDLEFLVAIPPSVDFRDVRPRMATWSREATAVLTDEVRTEIEFGPVELGHFARHARPSIFLYDLLTHGKVIWGPQNVLETIPQLTREGIPREDCLALLFNRTMEQLDAYDRVPSLDEPALIDLAYQQVKLVLDIAGSALAFAGRHSPSYERRPAEFARLIAETSALACVLPSNFMHELDRAAQTKISPDARALGLPGSSPHARRAWLRHQILTGLPALAAFVRWELEELLGRRGDLSELLPHYLRAQPWPLRARAWAKAMLHPIPAPLPIDLVRAARLFFVSTPAALLYSAAMLAALGLGGAPARSAAMRPWLFVRGNALGETPEAPRKAIVALWRWCVRNN